MKRRLPCCCHLLRKSSTQLANLEDQKYSIEQIAAKVRRLANRRRIARPCPLAQTLVGARGEKWELLEVHLETSSAPGFIRKSLRFEVHPGNLESGDSLGFLTRMMNSGYAGYERLQKWHTPSVANTFRSQKMNFAPN